MDTSDAEEITERDFLTSLVLRSKELGRNEITNNTSNTTEQHDISNRNILHIFKNGNECDCISNSINPNNNMQSYNKYELCLKVLEIDKSFSSAYFQLFMV